MSFETRPSYTYGAELLTENDSAPVRDKIFDTCPKKVNTLMKRLLGLPWFHGPLHSVFTAVSDNFG